MRIRELGFYIAALMVLVFLSACADDDPAPTDAPDVQPTTAEVDTPEEAVPTKVDAVSDETPVVEEPAAEKPVVVFDNLHVPSPAWEDQIIYFLMTDRFNDGDPSNNDQGAGEYDPQDGRKYSGGDLQGVIDQLDYIQELGATAVWITPPVANQWWDPQVQFGGYHGYWSEDFKQVDSHLGDLQTYQSLSDALHDRGMYLIQDIVANHTGNFFSYQDENGRTQYDPADPALYVHPNPDSVPVTRPSQHPFDQNDVTDPDQKDMAVYHWTPGIDDFQNEQQRLTHQLFDLDDLNTENPLVREALRDSYGYWIENAGVDGFRIDTVIYVEHDFWNDFVHSEDDPVPGLKKTASTTGRDDFFTIGETFLGSEPLESIGDIQVASYLGTEETPELDSVLNFPLYLSIGRVFAEGLPTSYLAYRLNVAQDTNIYPNPNSIVNFIDNHDVTRFLARGSAEGLKQATMFLMTVPGIPVIYYGTEQGFTEQRASMFAEGYGASEADHFDLESEFYQHIQSMTGLRKSNPIFTRGSLATLKDNDAGPGVLAYRRDYEGETAIVIFNTADRPVLMTDLDTGLPPGSVLKLQESLFQDQDLIVGTGGKITMELAGREGMVLLASEEIVELEDTTAEVTVSPEIEDQLFADDFLVVGTVSEPGTLIKVIVNGDLSRAIEVTADEEGNWSTEIRLSEFAPGVTANTVAAYAPSLTAASDTFNFSTEVTTSSSRVTTYDRTGDDVGPFDSYTLPTDETFGDQMDIRRLIASAFGTNLQLEVEMGEVTDVWDPANGFDHVLFHIYIDLPGQEGLTILPRINAQTPEGFDWDYLGFMEGWSNRLYYAKDASEEEYGTVVTPAPQVSVNIPENTISFLFTSEALGNPETLDGAKIYIATWDWNGPDAEYRFLRPGGGQWGFGGGDWSVDPLIIDDTEVIALAQDTLLSQPDPAGDHYGPYSAGQIQSYTLPTDEGFADQMDLRQADISSSDDGLLISITTTEISDSLEPPNGFDHVLFNVYLDLVEEQGSTVLPRQNAGVPPGFGWDYLAAVDGWGNRLYASEGSSEGEYGTEIATPAQISVDPETNVIHLLFDPQSIEMPDDVENVKVYITTWDIDNESGDYRPLTEAGGQWEFGGGDGSRDPLIIDDLLAGMSQLFFSQIPPTPQVEVTFEVIVPDGTSEDAILYLTGPFNQWNPADVPYQFNYAGDGVYRLVLFVDEGEFIEYRITRGSFANAEKYDPDDRFANRELSVPVGGESLDVAIDIPGWWDD